MLGRLCRSDSGGSAKFTVTIKLKIPKRKKAAKAGKGFLSRDPVIRTAFAVFIVLSVCVCGFFSYFYIKYGRIVDQRFKGPVFSSSASIYALSQRFQIGREDVIKQRPLSAFS